MAKMTRREIHEHAAKVADLYLDYNGTPEESFERHRLASVIELAMCRAAGVEWGPSDRLTEKRKGVL